MEYDASNANFFVYARRKSDTMLASMGHDVKIRVEDFTIDADFEAGEVRARVAADSLDPVDAIIWESRQETGELSEGDRREISQRMSEEVLDAEDFPDIEFESSDVEETDDGWHVVGNLHLHGEQREVEFDAVRSGDRVQVETTIDHTDFSIEPYSAMLGSLEVDPEVVVTIEAPLPDDE